MRAAILALLMLLGLAGCGIKGPLYLPDPQAAAKAGKKQPGEQPAAPSSETPAR